MDFFEWDLKVAVRSGKGGSHFMLLPRSPWVPSAHNQDTLSLRSGWSGKQIVYVNSALVATGGQS